MIGHDHTYSFIDLILMPYDSPTIKIQTNPAPLYEACPSAHGHCGQIKLPGLVSFCCGTAGNVLMISF